MKKLLGQDLPLQSVGPHLRHALRRALASSDPQRLRAVGRLLVADLTQQGVLLRVSIDGQNDTLQSYCLVRGTQRLIDLSALGEKPVAGVAFPDPGLAPDPTGPAVTLPENAILTDFSGVLGAMEEAQDLEVGFPRSGETGVILAGILRLLRRFTPQFELFALLFDQEILPEGQDRIILASPEEMNRGWLSLRQKSHTVWIPSARELPAAIQDFHGKHPELGDFASSVAVPILEPDQEGVNQDQGRELGLLFLVAREPWDRDVLLKLGQRLSRFVTRRWQHQREVNQRIHTDSLTKVYNRAFFDAQFPLELERARRSNQPLTLVICDLDHFKRVNDTYLHVNGDLVLQMVARRLREELRRIDHVCRIGGEEFALILPDTTQESAQEVMERLLDAPFTQTIEHQGQSLELSVTFSYGAATFPQSGTDAEELYLKADAMVFLSKDVGRNQCHFWSSEGDHTQLLPHDSRT